MPKNKVELIINNKSYIIAGEDSPEYLYRVGVYVDKKMKEISAANAYLSTSDVAVLTAVNIADELLKLRDEHHDIDEMLKDKMEEITTKEVPAVSQETNEPAQVKVSPPLDKTHDYFNRNFRTPLKK